MTELSAESPFSLTRGGPFFRLLRRIRLVAPPGRIRWIWLVPLAWLPILVATLFRVIAGEPPSPVFLDASIHVRLVVSLPLLLIAGRLLDERVERVTHLMRTEGIAERGRIDAILASTERLRDSWAVEALIALVVVMRSQVLLWGVTPADAMLRGTESYGLSFASIWYLGFGLPLLNFVMLRWLWQWGLWTSVLVRVSRLPLTLNGMHPDGAAGLKFLSMPTSAFATFVASVMCIASATWSTKILEGHAKLETFAPTLVVVLIVAVVFAFGPLMLFSTQVCRTRHRDLAAYHSFAREYVTEFKRAWLAGDPCGKDKNVLGLADIQSLNDLGGGYVTTEKTSMFPFGVRTLATLWLGAILPMLPVILSAMPLSEVAEHLGKLVLGGLPA